MHGADVPSRCPIDVRNGHRGLSEAGAIVRCDVRARDRGEAESDKDNQPRHLRSFEHGKTPTCQLFSPPAANHALKSLVAWALVAPLCGMFPPNHVKHDWFVSTIVAGG